jgi:transcription elongation GreA/GreB family factor
MHVIDMQKNKMSIVKRYSMDYDKYTAALDLLNGYIHDVEDYLDNASVTDGEQEAPFVIIGSAVDILEKASGRVQTFTIVPPGRNGLSKSGSQVVSCFCSFGRALLLKKEGHEISIEETGGRAAGVIQRIRYDLKL